MQQQKTYADNGMAQMLRDSRRSFTKEQMQRGACIKAQRQKIGVIDGVERADAKLRRFSWEAE